MRKVKFLLLMTTIISIMGACQNGTSSDDTDADLTIYTTVYPLEYIAGEIGGDTVDVSSVYPPGADGHSYEPTMQEMTQYADGDAFFYVGDNMEAFSDSIASSLGDQDVQLIGLSEHEELFQRHNHEEEVSEGEESSLSLEGVQDHYHTDDTIELNVNYTGGNDHFHWYTRTSEDDGWSEVNSEYHDELEIEATEEIGQIKVEQFDENHEVLTESEPIDIIIDDHEGEEDNHGSENNEDNQDMGSEETDSDIMIENVANHYHTGDMIELTASVAVEYDQLQWSTTSPSNDEWTEVEESDDTSFEGEATELSQVKVAALDENEEIIEESDPVDIVIDDHEDNDPHIWIDPIKMIEVAEIVRDEMIELNPEEEEFYTENFETLKGNLEALDEEFHNTLENEEEQQIIVPHAAFGYWEKYGIEQIPVTGYTMTDEPSQQQLGELINTAEEYDLDYVLYEQNNEDNISRVIQDEIGAEAEMIHNMEVRTEEDIDNDEDYISLMERNLEILSKVTE